MAGHAMLASRLWVVEMISMAQGMIMLAQQVAAQVALVVASSVASVEMILVATISTRMARTYREGGARGTR